MIKINYFNQYDEAKEYKKIIKKVIKTGYRHLQIKGKQIINIILVDDQEIQRMNKEFRAIDRPTDVLSFDNPGSVEIGDVFISVDKAKQQAIEYGHSFERELAFLTCHGYLHCNQFDHQTKEEEQEMFRLQDEILNKATFKR